MSPILLLDTETTGLNPDVHEVVELEGRMLDEDLNVIDTFYRKLKPMRLDRAEKQAMDINGYNFEVWEREGVDAACGYADFAAWLKKCCDKYPATKKGPARAVVVGQNPGFDIAFIKSHAKELGINIEFHYHQIDTVGITYFLDMLVKGRASSYSLTHTTKRYKIEHKGQHTASGDNQAVLDLLKLWINILRKGDLKIIEESCYDPIKNSNLQLNR